MSINFVFGKPLKLKEHNIQRDNGQWGAMELFMFEQYENSILQLHFLSAIGKPLNVLNLV